MSVCVGCGMEVVDGVLQPKLDPAGGLECTDAGIKANFPAGVVVPGVSPDACNGFKLRGNGYFADCPQTIAGIHSDPVGAISDSVSGPNDTYTYTGAVTTITNTTCRDITGIVTFQVGGLFMDNLVHNFLTLAHLEINTNGGGWVSTSPANVSRRHNNNDVNAMNIDFDNMIDSVWLAPLAAAGVVTYQPRLIITVIGAATVAGTVQGNLVFETQWVLTETGSCP